MFKFIVLIVCLFLLSPIFTSLIDSLCWFYTSSTCTGLVYDIDRVGVILLMSVAALMLSLTVFG